MKEKPEIKKAGNPSLPADFISPQPSPHQPHLHHVIYAVIVERDHVIGQAGIDEASSSARMNQYEKGKHQPDQDMALRIAKVLDLPLAYFYADDDELAAVIMDFHSSKQNSLKS